MVDMIKNITSKKTTQKPVESSSWVAYLKPNDSLAAEHGVTGSEHIRILQDNKFPLFHLSLNGKKVGTVTARELLWSLGDGNIEFDEYSDRKNFIEALGSALIEADRVRAVARKALRIGGIVIGACGVVALTAMSIQLSIAKKNK